MFKVICDDELYRKTTIYKILLFCFTFCELSIVSFSYRVILFIMTCAFYNFNSLSGGFPP
jgi:hypothetical protein